MQQMTLPYNFALPYPLSVNHYYYSGHYRGRTFVKITNEGLAFKRFVQKNYSYICRPLSGNVAMQIIIHPKLTKTNKTSLRVIDLDNGLKCILDSLIGIAYLDDKQVKQLNIRYGDAIKDGGTSVAIYASQYT